MLQQMYLNQTEITCKYFAFMIINSIIIQSLGAGELLSLIQPLFPEV